MLVHFVQPYPPIYDVHDIDDLPLPSALYFIQAGICEEQAEIETATVEPVGEITSRKPKFKPKSKRRAIR